MRSIMLLFSGLLLYAGGFVAAQEMPQVLLTEQTQRHGRYGGCCSRAAHATHAPRMATESAIVRRAYDVLSYDVYLNWAAMLRAEEINAATRGYNGRNTIRLRVDSAGVRELVFDASNLAMDAVYINGAEVLPTPQPVENLLRIPLASAPEAGSELSLQIDFRNVSERNIGFFVFEKGTVSGAHAIPERLAYLLSAPNYTRNWMPCNDAPYDKARLSMQVEVPAGFNVAANGLLIAVDTLTAGAADTNHVFHWQDDTPVATYLMTAHASRYHRYSDWYYPADAPGDSIEVQYYCWADDLDGSRTPFNAQATFGRTVEMMTLFAGQFGPYPFARYGMAVAEPFSYGAMENQTMVTVGRSVLRENFGTVAHELMHMWLGDLTTPATWNDIWMNEGGATYGEALWAEHSEGFEGYIAEMNSKRSFYLAGNINGRNQPACYRTVDPFRTADIYNYAVTYSKGAWIYHMLRQLAGDEVFFPAMRSFLERYAYDVAETEDLIAVLDEQIGSERMGPLSTVRAFFDQWVYSRGHPMYDMEVDIVPLSDSEVYTTIRLQQIQSGTEIPDVFVMPVEVAFRAADGRTAVHTFDNTAREQEFSVALPFVPQQVFFDPDHKILCIPPASPVLTNVETRARSDTALQVWPNPAGTDAKAFVRFGVAREAFVSLDVYSLLGECIAVLHRGRLPQGTYTESWNTFGVAPGAYLVHCSIDGRSSRQVLIVGE